MARPADWLRRRGDLRGGRHRSGAALGYGLALVSMACIVTATFIAKAQTQPTPLLPSLALQSTVSAVLFLPLALWDGTAVPEPMPEFAAAVAWFITLSTLGAYGFYWACLARTLATRVASLIYLTPPVTMVWSFAVFGEAITASAVLGFLICLSGVWLASNRVRLPQMPAPARHCGAGCP